MPNHDRDGQSNVMSQIPSYPLRTTNKVPATHDLYIGQIPGEVDINMLHSFFSQFGEIERVFEGRGRQASTGMKWAFISYMRAEDAYKYAIIRALLSVVCCNKLGGSDSLAHYCSFPFGST
jgi:hypothetical protein